MATNPFLLQRFAAQSAGIAIVRNVLKKNVFPGGYFTTKELYKLAIQEPPPPKFEPYPLKSPVQDPKTVTKSKKRSYGSPAIRPMALNYPEHPEHPIRSIKFLKEFVLPHLEGSKEVRMQRKPAFVATDASDSATTKAHVTGSHTKYAWKVIPPEERPKPPAPPPTKEVVGTEVGVGEDFSHLNRRRKAARVGKISAQVTRLKSYKSHSEMRDPLIERLETNPILLNRVHQLAVEAPRLNVDDLASVEMQARRLLPGGQLQTEPIEGEEMLKKLDTVKRHLAFNRLNKPSVATPRKDFAITVGARW